MNYNRSEVVDQNFLRILETWEDDPAAQPGALTPDDRLAPSSRLTGRVLLELFESQMASRHLDLVARKLRQLDRAFYTIGSSGHEGNVVVGRVSRHTDPAFLHYRSGALMIERARHLPAIDPIYDTTLSQVASAEDPISGGRHKVWGSKPLWILPQTSTIASHLPKSVGTAIAIWRAGKLQRELPIPSDSIAICSFGDASTNHSTAQGAFNLANWAQRRGWEVPILFVCEDNGIGISTDTPAGFIRESFSARPGLTYFGADGLDLVDAYEIAARAVDHARTTRRPAFLHLSVVRMLGHAGSDVEFEYHSEVEIELVEAEDPLLHTARLVLDAGLLTADQIRGRYEATRMRVQEAADRAVERPRLETKEQVMGPLAPYTPAAVTKEASRKSGVHVSLEAKPGRHLAALLNVGLHELMTKYPEAIVFGEDVAKKGGVYNVTTGLQGRFGPERVFDTLLDEQSILGLAQGAANMGFLPIPEIQYLAYFHNACDQIRGEASSLQYFSNDQYRNPMLLRMASLAYQRGFGGHFHNDNSITALRDIPGLVLACPSRGDDAIAMLRTCAALARVDGRIVAFLEPIALYMTKDLHEPKDGGWQFDPPAAEVAIPLGEGRVYRPEHRDLVIFTYGNGAYLSLRAARVLERQHGVRARIADLRWLNPLNRLFIAEQATQCGRVLIVDEGRRTGGLGEGIITAIAESCGPGLPVGRVCGEDTYIPLGPAAYSVLPSEGDIIREARALMGAEVAERRSSVRPLPLAAERGRRAAE